MKAESCQYNIPSNPIQKFKNHSLLLFDLTSMQDATGNYHYRELVAERLRLELNFIFPPEQVTELVVLGQRRSSVAVDMFGVVGKSI